MVVVVVSRVAGHLTARLGIGPVAFLGALAFAAGPTWWLIHLGVVPDYATGMLPGQLLTGLGVGLLLPTLSSVVGSALPAAQWGSGSSLINTARQVGSVLGVALLVTVIGVHTTGLPSELGSVRAGWALLVGAAFVAALVALILTAAERRRRGGDRVAGSVAPPAVRGTVREAAGPPVPGAVVTVIGAGGAQLGRAVADERGRFTAPIAADRLRPGEQVVVLAGGPGHDPRAARVALGADATLELVRRRSALEGAGHA
jgi:MFS family permease